VVARRQQDARPRRDVTAWLARYLIGPPQVTDPTEPLRPPTEEERARDEALRTELVRVTDASGRTYLVSRDDV
jgi:hypothetical protein